LDGKWDELMQLIWEGVSGVEEASMEIIFSERWLHKNVNLHAKPDPLMKKPLPQLTLKFSHSNRPVLDGSERSVEEGGMTKKRKATLSTDPDGSIVYCW
jgi:hypothetical protein